MGVSFSNAHDIENIDSQETDFGVLERSELLALEHWSHKRRNYIRFVVPRGIFGAIRIPSGSKEDCIRSEYLQPIMNHSYISDLRWTRNPSYGVRIPPLAAHPWQVLLGRPAAAASPPAHGACTAAASATRTHTRDSKVGVRVEDHILLPRLLSLVRLLLIVLLLLLRRPPRTTVSIWWERSVAGHPRRRAPILILAALGDRGVVGVLRRGWRAGVLDGVARGVALQGTRTGLVVEVCSGRRPKS